VLVQIAAQAYGAAAPRRLTCHKQPIIGTSGRLPALYS
jgi:hypothetical protein